jgi:uncharacterized membrane protein
VQRALERGLNPLLSVLPLGLFGAAVLFDFGSLVSGFDLFGGIAYWVLATAVLGGLICLTALLVDFMATPVGSLAHRMRGLASASISATTVTFTFAWLLRTEGPRGGNTAVFLLEVAAFVGGVVGVVAAKAIRRPFVIEFRRPRSADPSWPFEPAR